MCRWAMHPDPQALSLSKAKPKSEMSKYRHTPGGPGHLPHHRGSAWGTTVPHSSLCHPGESKGSASCSAFCWQKHAWALGKAKVLCSLSHCGQSTEPDPSRAGGALVPPRVYLLHSPWGDSYLHHPRKPASLLGPRPLLGRRPIKGLLITDEETLKWVRSTG